ncbi:hypothetical protein PENTCL1PPCAC_20638, partial [Pristionchus entomophagus]
VPLFFLFLAFAGIENRQVTAEDHAKQVMADMNAKLEGSSAEQLISEFEGVPDKDAVTLLALSASYLLFAMTHPVT